MRKYLFVAFMCVIGMLHATIPNNYYSAVDGKSGNAILPALHGIISSHTDVGYDGLYSVYQARIKYGISILLVLSLMDKRNVVAILMFAIVTIVSTLLLSLGLEVVNLKQMFLMFILPMVK